QENAKLINEKVVFIVKFIKLEQTTRENDKLKAKVTKFKYINKENTKLIIKINYDIKEIKKNQIATNISSALSTKDVLVQISISMPKSLIYSELLITFPISTLLSIENYSDKDD
ncbi:5487_t:CDS:1, partial [Scutellospora calospora]